MFPASNSSAGNPFPQYTSSSSFHSSSPFLGLNGNQILLDQYYQNQFSSHYLAKNIQDHCANSLRSSFSIKKKERCSKILTAQGPRDRRVRLSIGIARKFFDLQEMLGATKSICKESITKEGASYASECEDMAIATNRVKEKDEAIDHVQIARESRAKARARARERTIKKMWSRLETSHISANLIGKKNIREMEEQFCKNKLQANKEIIEGSGVTKIKIKPSLFLGFHPNLCAPIESVYGSSSFNNGNWDICRNIVKPTETAAITTVTSSLQGIILGFKLV
ncbi:hypothetical protein K7X08_023777 [Anisodus acutangulus]|uniref:Cycloidea-like protein n=1 Tax=Anisodus acutangulus TaxID=402998 RepID=A0A9Q1L8R5_9SOLA|nr:hypothetical protein K7X08_023777 [Anisodus acutangulus]